MKRLRAASKELKHIDAWLRRRGDDVDAHAKREGHDEKEASLRDDTWLAHACG